MRWRWVLACVVGLAAACGSNGPAYLKVTVTSADPLVDLALVEALTVRWAVDGVEPHVDVPVGDVLRDGATSFVLQMPGGVTVTGLTAEGTGPGGALLASAPAATVELAASGTREVTLALGPPAGPRPLTCADGSAPALRPTVRVTDAPEHSIVGSVAWLGTGWAVSFEDARYNEPEKSHKNPFVALLAPDGTKLGDEIRADDGWCYSAGSQLVWTGSRLLLLWYSCAPSPDGNNYDLLFRAFDASGAPLGPVKQLTQAVANHENWRTGGALWDGTRLVMTANRLVGDGPDWDLLLHFRDEEGELLDEPLLFDRLGGAQDVAPRLAWSGSSLALAYDVADGGPTTGRLLVRSPSGHEVGEPIDLGAGAGATVTWAGDRFVAALLRRASVPAQLQLVSVTADGAVSAPLLLPIAGAVDPTSLALASTGSDVGVVVPHNTTALRNGVAFQRVADWLAPVGAAAPLRDGGAKVYAGTLAAGPSGYGVAWTDDSAGNWEIFFAAVGCFE